MGASHLRIEQAGYCIFIQSLALPLQLLLSSLFKITILTVKVSPSMISADSAWITDENFESILDNPKYQRSQPISVRVIVSELSDVDTSTQTFVCHMKLIFQIVGEDVEEEIFEEIEISFPNMVERFFESESTVEEDSRCIHTRTFRAKFKSLFNLEAFPFDYQKLSIM